MRFTKRVGKKLISSKSRTEDYLEVKVRGNTSVTDVAEIIQALATISSFFGARLDLGGGGSGGSPLFRVHPTVTSSPPFLLDSPKIIIPPQPQLSPDSKIGGGQ